LEGRRITFLPIKIYSDVSYSPDGQFILISTIEKPYPYIVPYDRFPENTDVYKAEGKLYLSFNAKPIIEELPKGFDAVQTGKRSASWRAVQGANLLWLEAQDGGYPSTDTEFRDVVYQMPVQNRSNLQLIAKTKLRYLGITKGTSEIAVLSEGWW
jgi:hypothetical protein